MSNGEGKPNETENPDLLTPEEVCYTLRISRGTLRTLMKNRQLHPVLVGKRYRIPRDELESYLHRNRGILRRRTSSDE